MKSERRERERDSSHLATPFTLREHLHSFVNYPLNFYRVGDIVNSCRLKNAISSRGQIIERIIQAGTVEQHGVLDR